MITKLLFLVLLFPIWVFAQANKKNAEEIARLINDYRKERKLPPVPISEKLTKVAEAHVIDLMANPPSGHCNLHSWSSDGNWTSCCYTNNHSEAACMWQKPKEISGYNGNGYEIAHWHSQEAAPATAVEGWKKSKGHHEVIANLGIWKNQHWKAMGVGIYGKYAVVWFGTLPDE